MSVVFLMLLSTLMGACAIALVGSRNLFAIIALLSCYSGCSAVLLVGLGAVDVAFTEAVVGTGVSTVFLMALMRRVDARVESSPSRPQLWGAACAVVAVAIPIFVGIHSLPSFGDPESPASRHIAPDYSVRSLEDTKTPNVVTAVLADYRGFDTLMETSVILVAALGCAMLLSRGRRSP